MPAPSSFSAALAEGKPAALRRLTQALDRHGGNKSAAARDLELNYKTLWKIGERHPHVKAVLNQYGLEQAEAASVAWAARSKRAKARKKAAS